MNAFFANILNIFMADTVLLSEFMLIYIWRTALLLDESVVKMVYFVHLLYSTVSSQN